MPWSSFSNATANIGLTLPESPYYATEGSGGLDYIPSQENAFPQISHVGEDLNVPESVTSCADTACWSGFYNMVRLPEAGSQVIPEDLLAPEQPDMGGLLQELFDPGLYRCLSCGFYSTNWETFREHCFSFCKDEDTNPGACGGGYPASDTTDIQAESLVWEPTPNDWVYESPEHLEKIAGDLRDRVDDWYGLDVRR